MSDAETLISPSIRYRIICWRHVMVVWASPCSVPMLGINAVKLRPRRWRRSDDILAQMQARLTFVATQGLVACTYLADFQSNPCFWPMVCRMPYVWRDDTNDFDRNIWSFDSPRLGRRAGRTLGISATAGVPSVSEYSASGSGRCPKDDPTARREVSNRGICITSARSTRRCRSQICARVTRLSVNCSCQFSSTRPGSASISARCTVRPPKPLSKTPII
jgi:hypothetical protein